MAIVRRWLGVLRDHTPKWFSKRGRSDRFLDLWNIIACASDGAEEGLRFLHHLQSRRIRQMPRLCISPGRRHRPNMDLWMSHEGSLVLWDVPALSPGWNSDSNFFFLQETVRGDAGGELQRGNTPVCEQGMDRSSSRGHRCLVFND